MELNKIYNEDCLEGMKRIPDKSVDMILCDLPYGTTRNKWDSIIPLDLLWEQYNRIIKDNGAIVLTAQTPFDKVLGVSNLKYLRYEWIWQKDNASNFLNARRNPMKVHENILIFYRKMPKYQPQMREGYEPYQSARSAKRVDTYMNNYDTTYVSSSSGKRFPISVLTFNSDRGLHPTQKPVALFEYLIKTYTDEGENVLDNCMGSGTTAIACMNTGRNYIGFEMDTNYFNLANERIEQHLNPIQR